MIKGNTKEIVFINLVRSVIRNEEPSALPNGVSVDDIFNIGLRQDMFPITYCGLNSISPKPISDKWNEYQNTFLSDCTRSEIQVSEYKKLVKYLCDNNVKIIPLKGCVIKEYYPVPNYRVMSDVDLLYDGVSIDQLANLMKEFGYSAYVLGEFHHDAFRKKPCMNVELHRMLEQEGSPYKVITDDMFSKAIKDDKIENLFHLKPEDYYIHVIVHTAKHFKSSGIGIRPILDIYLLNEKFSNGWNKEYLNKQFKTVDLDTFERKIKDLAYALFGNEEREISNEEIMFLFRGGAFGKMNDPWAFYSLGFNNTFKTFIFRTFLPYNRMILVYPTLKKMPILLPFFWIYRLINFLLHGKNKKSELTKTIYNEKDAKYVQRIMNTFGLDE